MRIIILAAFLFSDTLAVLAACPNSAPTPNGGVATYCPDAKYADQACPNGLVSFKVVWQASNGFPPAPYIPAYELQACDSVRWEFGDGTSRTVTGSPDVTHNFPSPGNYTVCATVTNALGSTTFRVPTSRVIATSPSRLSFITKDTSSCINCVLARENDDAATIVVERSLDLSRTVSAVARIDAPSSVPGITSVAVPLTFLPGETRKSFTVPIANDDKFYGHRYYPLFFSDESGGTFTFRNISQQPYLTILEDDPRPVLSIATPWISVREGDLGLMPVTLRAELSETMLVDAVANAYYQQWTAHWDDFTGGYGPRIPAGGLSAPFDAGAIRGDTRVEPDEQFFVDIAPIHSTNDPAFGVTRAVVTILNDDAALVPDRLSMKLGSVATLTLDLGSPYASPMTIAFSSSNENTITRPYPVTIPANVTRIDVPVTGVRAGSVVLTAIAPDRTVQPAILTVSVPRQRSARH